MEKNDLKIELKLYIQLYKYMCNKYIYITLELGQKLYETKSNQKLGSAGWN